MKNIRGLIFVFLAGTCVHLNAQVITGVFGSPGPTGSGPTDPDGIFIAAGGANSEAFGFEGNINLTRQEIRINALTAPDEDFVFSVAKNTAFQWESGRDYSFKMDYSGDTMTGTGGGTLDVSITDTTNSAIFSIPSYDVDYGDVNALVFRQRVEGNNAQSTFSNLALDGDPLLGTYSLTSSGAGRVNYFAVVGDFTQPWELTGTVNVSWVNEPEPNRLSWQIKGWRGNPSVIPEPSASALAASLFLVMLCIHRRRGA